MFNIHTQLCEHWTNTLYLVNQHFISWLVNKRSMTCQLGCGSWTWTGLYEHILSCSWCEVMWELFCVKPSQNMLWAEVTCLQWWKWSIAVIEEGESLWSLVCNTGTDVIHSLQVWYSALAVAARLAIRSKASNATTPVTTSGSASPTCRWSDVTSASSHTMVS